MSPDPNDPPITIPLKRATSGLAQCINNWLLIRRPSYASIDALEAVIGPALDALATEFRLETIERIKPSCSPKTAAKSKDI